MRKQLLFLLFLIPLLSFGQILRMNAFYVPDKSTNFPINLPVYSLIFVGSNDTLYSVTSSYTTADDINQVITDGNYVAYPSGGVGYWTLSGDTLYTDSTDWYVGIGTSTPASKLDVVGSGIFSNNLTVGDRTVLGGFNDTTYIGGGNASLVYNGSHLYLDVDNKLYLTSNASDVVIKAGGLGGDELLFYNGGTLMMAMSDADMVGIKDQTPEYTLDVNGNFRVVEEAIFDSVVGIGTTTPTSNLHIVDENSTIINADLFETSSVAHPHLSLNKYNGTISSYAALDAGEYIGAVDFAGSISAASTIKGFTIDAYSTEAWSGLTYGTGVDFSTIMNGDNGQDVRIRLTGDGSIGFGGDVLPLYNCTYNAGSRTLQWDSIFVCKRIEGGGDLSIGGENTTDSVTIDAKTFLYNDIYTDRWDDEPSNTYIGVDVVGGDGLTDSPSGNTVTGYLAGYDATSFSNNTIYGAGAGTNLTSAEGNILVGVNAGGQLTTEDNLLFIDNTNTTTPLIHGDLSADSVKIHGTFTTNNAFGEMYFSEADTISTATTSWYSPTKFTLGDFYGTSVVGDTGLVITQNGWYNVNASPSFEHTNTNVVIHYGIFVNDVLDAGMQIERTIGTGANQFGSGSLSGIIKITNAPDTLQLKVNADKTGNLISNHTNVTAKRIR